jgi:hypothetical protein
MLTSYGMVGSAQFLESLIHNALIPPIPVIGVIVDAAAWNSTQVGKGAHVTVDKGDGVAALIEPDKFASPVHQPQQKLPRHMPLAVQLHGDLKEVDLSFVAHPMNQWYINFCPLTLALAQVLVNRGQANLITFL